MTEYHAFLLLGSNINKTHNIPKAISLLKKEVTVLKTSSIYESEAVNCPHDPHFFNCAIKIKTPLTPKTLKFNCLRKIEKTLKRVRTQNKDAPRTIDIDLLLFEDWISTDPICPLPSPDILHYAHILVPLTEIEPNYIHPLKKTPLKHFLNTLPKTQLKRHPSKNTPPSH